MAKGLNIFMICLALLSGCARTEYKPYEANSDSPINPSRTVYFHVDQSLTESPPDCVLVLPPQANGPPGLTSRLEKTLARHLSDRFPRVISGSARNAKAINLALDLDIPADRREFTRGLDCDAVFEFRILRPKHTYMLIWSEIRIGLEARLARGRDGRELWKARHVASRSDGGLSLTPLGLAFNAYNANSLSSDGDIVESVTEDLVRRLMKSMPVLRTNLVETSGNQ